MITLGEKKKSLWENSLFFMTYRLFNAFFPLVTSAYIARVLMPEGVGKIAVAQNIVTYFTYIAALGMPTYGMRVMARNRESNRRNMVFSELFTINGVSSIICTIAYSCFLMFFLHDKVDIELYLIFGILIAFNIINVDWVYQGLEEYKYISIRSFAIKLISFFLTLIFVREKNDLCIYALILCFATVGNYVFNIWNLLRKKIVNYTYHGLRIIMHLRPLLVLFASSIAIELYTLVDTTMLGATCADEIVGYYTNSIKIVKTVIICFVAISAVAAPAISNLFGKNDKEEIKKIISKMFSVLFIIAVPATVGLFLISNLLIPSFFGGAFVPAITTLKILSFLILPISLSTFFGGQILCSVDQEKKMLIATIAGAITNIILNSILIRLYQQNGAAVASVISEIVVALIDCFFVIKLIGFRIKVYDIFSCCLSALVMGLIVFALMNTLTIGSVPKMLICIMVGGMGYACMLIFSRNSLAKEFIAIVRRRMTK